jgi:hypothetical protein
VPQGRQVEVEEQEELLARVAAIDVAKASGMVCTRVPHQAKAGKRVRRVSTFVRQTHGGITVSWRGPPSAR